MTFWINDCIREVIRTHEDVSNPYDLAKVVLAAIPPSETYNVLARVLGPYVKEIVRESRTQALRRCGNTYDGPPPDLVRVQLEYEAWRDRVLLQRVAIDGTWKFLGACSVGDLRWLAAFHRQLAADNEDRAEMYDRYADQMEARGATVLSDMTEEPVAA